MATGLAVLLTCLSTACGGGNRPITTGPLSFADDTSDVIVAADVGADDPSDVIVAAAGNGATAQAVGGRKSGGLPAGQNRGEGPGNGTDVGTGTDTDRLLVAVDVSKIPAPGTGTSALKVVADGRVAPPAAVTVRSASPAPTPTCRSTIRSSSGQPGRSASAHVLRQHRRERELDGGIDPRHRQLDLPRRHRQPLVVLGADADRHQGRHADEAGRVHRLLQDRPASPRRRCSRCRPACAWSPATPTPGARFPRSSCALEVHRWTEQGERSLPGVDRQLRRRRATHSGGVLPAMLGRRQLSIRPITEAT